MTQTVQHIEPPGQQSGELQAVLDALCLGIIRIDADLRVKAVNKRYFELIGVPDGLLRAGDTIEPLIRYKIGVEDVPEADVERLVGIRLARARELKAFKYQHRQESGRIVEIIGTLLPGGELLTTYEDVTERVQADSARQAASETLSAIIQASPMAIIVRDLMHRVIQWNNAAEHLLGWRADEILGRNHALFPGDPEPDQALKPGSGKTAASGREELEIARKDGRVVQIALWSTPLLDLHGDLAGTLLIAEDIDDRKRAERAIIEAKDAAELASRAKSEFLSTVTHELKTPLHSVIGFAEIVERELTALDGPGMSLGYLKDIRQSGQQLLEVIDDVVDITRAESKELSIASNLISLPKLLRSAARSYDARAAQKSIELRLDCHHGLPAITSDQRHLRRIIDCLLSNAIKFTPSGGRIGLEALREWDGRLMISITDTGIGMDKSQMARIFDPFAQGDRSLSRRFEGMGLGLTLAKKLAAALNLSLSFESVPGEGTQASIHIPSDRVTGVERAPAT